MTYNDITTALDRNAFYGVDESNPIALSSHSHLTVDYSLGDIQLDNPELVSINRLRLLTDRGSPLYDISYCYGTMRDGTHVRVNLGVQTLTRRGIKGELIAIAKEAGRFAKGLGLLDEGNWSILRG